MIPSAVIRVPLFVVLRVLGLLNTLERLITLEVAGGVAFATTTFLRGVPRELEDAARIDGASSVQVLRHIMLPLAAPGIAAVTVFQSVFVWNDYFAPLIVIQKPSLFTVQLAMGNFSNFYATNQALPAAELHRGIDRGRGARLVAARPLLETKLHIPTWRRGLVARPRLHERLNRGAPIAAASDSSRQQGRGVGFAHVDVVQGATQSGE
jgi:hypothetical protein